MPPPPGQYPGQIYPAQSYPGQTYHGQGPRPNPRRTGMSGGVIALIVVGAFALLAVVVVFAVGNIARNQSARSAGFGRPSPVTIADPATPASADGWVEETVPSGAFSVTMPGPTSTTESEVPAGTATMSVGLMIADHGDEVEMAADYPMPPGFDVHNFDLRASASGALTGMGVDGVVTSFTPGNVGFLEGASFTGTASRSGTRFLVDAKLVTLTGHAAMLAVIYTEDASVDAHATLDRMVASFAPH